MRRKGGEVSPVQDVAAHLIVPGRFQEAPASRLSMAMTVVLSVSASKA